MLELRKAAVHAGGVPGDPVRPLSIMKEQQQHERTQVKAQPPQNSLSHSKAAPLSTAAAEGQPVLSAPLRGMGGQAPAASCPFSRGVPVTVTVPMPQADFAVIPMCCPAEWATKVVRESNAQHASLPKTASPTEQQRQAARILHAPVEQHEVDGSCIERLQQPQATLPDPDLHEILDAPRATASLTPIAISPAQKPASAAQPPSTRLQTHETPYHQQLHTRQDVEKEPGERQQEAAASARAQHKPSELTGAAMEPSKIESPKQQFCAEAGILPQQQVQHCADLPFATVGSSSSAAPSAVGTRMLAGSGSLDAVTLCGDREGTATLPAPIDGTTLLRDLQQIQSKKKVLFTPGHSSRGSPVEGNPFEAEEDSILDLS